MAEKTLWDISRIRAGDETEFAGLYEAYHGRVLGLCRRLLRSLEMAEEAADEVFLRAREKMACYDPAQSMARWLLAIAGNHCIDLLRRRTLEKRIFAMDPESLQPVSPDPGPLRGLLRAEAAATVRRAIESLAEPYRLALVLRYCGDLSYDEIACSLDLTRANAATLLYRAKQELRLKLSKGR